MPMRRQDWAKRATIAPGSMLSRPTDPFVKVKATACKIEGIRRSVQGLQKCPSVRTYVEDGLSA